VLHIFSPVQPVKRLLVNVDIETKLEKLCTVAKNKSQDKHKMMVWVIERFNYYCLKMRTSLNHRKKVEAGPGRRFLKQLVAKLELAIVENLQKAQIFRKRLIAMH